jgi:hypothetical protein
MAGYSGSWIGLSQRVVLTFADLPGTNFCRSAWTAPSPASGSARGAARSSRSCPRSRSRQQPRRLGSSPPDDQQAPRALARVPLARQRRATRIRRTQTGAVRSIPCPEHCTCPRRCGRGIAAMTISAGSQRLVPVTISRAPRVTQRAATRGDSRGTTVNRRASPNRETGGVWPG